MNIFNEVSNKTANTITINQREFAKNFGNVKTEYDALRNGAILYDCGSYGLFRVCGDDACDFLEELSTKEILFMNVGSISESCFLNDAGVVIGPVFISRMEEDFLVITFWEFADAVLCWMNLQKVKYNVEIIDLFKEKALLSVEGSMAWRVIKEIFDTEIENIAFQTSQQIQYAGKDLTIMRIGRTSEYGYLLMTDIDLGMTIYSSILSYATRFEFKVLESGMDCLEIAMLEIHQPNFGRETEQFGNVFELCQQWYIRYDKEEYHGYSAIQDILNSEIEKTSVSFIVENIHNILPGMVVLNEDGEDIGYVVYSLYSPGLDRQLGIAILQDPYNQSGLTLKVALQSEEALITTVSSPIVRPLSWDSKME